MILLVKKLLKGFPPLIGDKPTILILGSMPSVTSLEKQEYYGFAYNRFWRILEHTYECELSNYEEKQQCILNYHLGLWDVIAECEREGSLDSHIRNEKVNDIKAILKTYPSIQRIICNGRKSYDLYQHYFIDVKIECLYLPSTSNANRSMKEKKIFNLWNDALTKDLLDHK
ncbi:MAG: DNA-deoxyinosine glycosylase [Erysipelotrichaceae bacterium]